MTETTDLAGRFAADAAWLGLEGSETPRVAAWETGGRRAAALTGVSRLAARLTAVIALDAADPAVRRYAARPASAAAPEIAFDTRIDAEPALDPELVDLALTLVAHQVGADDAPDRGDTIEGVVEQPVPAPGSRAGAQVHGAIVRVPWGALDVVWPDAAGPASPAGAPIVAAGHLTARIFVHDPETVPADGRPLAIPRHPRAGTRAGRP
jgi:hypothetical protein